MYDQIEADTEYELEFGPLRDPFLDLNTFAV